MSHNVYKPPESFEPFTLPGRPPLATLDFSVLFDGDPHILELGKDVPPSVSSQHRYAERIRMKALGMGVDVRVKVLTPRDGRTGVYVRADTT